MITFHCATCGHSVRAPDDAAGKRAYCPKCNAISQVPAVEKAPGMVSMFCQNCGKPLFVKVADASGRMRCSSCTAWTDIPRPEGQSEAVSRPLNSMEDLEFSMIDVVADDDPPAAPAPSASPIAVAPVEPSAPAGGCEPDKQLATARPRADFRDTPRNWGSRVSWSVVACVVLVGGAAALYFGLQDTWEKDNRARILALVEQGDALLEGEQYRPAVKTYSEVLSLCKDRKLKSAELVKAVDRTRDNLAKAREPVNAADRLEKAYSRYGPQIDEALSKGDLAGKAGQFQEAIKHYQSAISTITTNNLTEKSAAELKRARQSRQAVHARWRTEIVGEISDKQAKAKAAVAAREFEKAARLYQSLVTFAEGHDLQTAAVKKAATAAREALGDIPRLEREHLGAEAARRAKEQKEELLAARKKAETESKRLGKLMLPPSKAIYRAVRKAYRDFVAIRGTDVDKLDAAREKLTKACKVLPNEDRRGLVVALRQTADQAIVAMRTYRGYLASRRRPKDPRLRSLFDKRWDMNRASLGSALAAAIYDCMSISKEFGKEITITSAVLAKHLEREKTKRLRGRQCTLCTGTGRMWCKACRIGSRVTGKARCEACKGTRRIVCNTCKGTWRKNQCSRCRGSGTRQTTERVRVKGGVAKMVRGGRVVRRRGISYHKNQTRTSQCSSCRGRGYTWFCSACSRFSAKKRGTVPCSTCRGTAFAGKCLACGGTKKARCTRCGGSGRRKGKELGREGKTPVAVDVGAGPVVAPSTRGRVALSPADAFRRDMEHPALAKPPHPSKDKAAWGAMTKLQQKAASKQHAEALRQWFKATNRKGKTVDWPLIVDNIGELGTGYVLTAHSAGGVRVRATIPKVNARNLERYSKGDRVLVTGKIRSYGRSNPVLTGRRSGARSGRTRTQGDFQVELMDARVSETKGRAAVREGTGEVSFFGTGLRGDVNSDRAAIGITAGRASHIVYVIDRSGSMEAGGAFDVVRFEAMRSIRGLKNAQNFHIILFADGRTIENPPRRLVPADAKRKSAAANFMKRVDARGKTTALPAIKRAFAVLSRAEARRKGKLIVLLTDGHFAGPGGGSRHKGLFGNKAVIQWLRDHNAKGEIHVNTYLYGNDPEARKTMLAIAQENGGKFKLVTGDE